MTDLRERLLDAVDLVVKERGVAELSLREAARRANVSHGAPAHHFRNKAGMLSAYAAAGFDQLSATISADQQSEPPANGREELHQLGCAYVRFALQNRQRFELMFRPEHLDMNDPGLERSRTEAMRSLRDGVARCVREELVHEGQREQVEVMVWALVHGLATLTLQRKLDVQDPEVLTRDVTRLFVDRVL